MDVNGQPQELSGLAFIFMIIGLIFAIFIIVAYVLAAIGLMTIAKREDEKYPWLAWIPIGNSYLLGKIGFNAKVGWILVILSIVVSFLSNITDTITSTIVPMTPNTTTIPYLMSSAGTPQMFVFILMAISMALGYAIVIIAAVAVYNIYRKYSTKAIPMLIWTGVTMGILSAIFLFNIRNNAVVKGTK